MTERPFSPELLRSYIAVCECGSFSGAARALGLRQSTVSQHLQRLEAATGRRLIDRDTHRVRITPPGELVLQHARRVLEAHEELGRALNKTPLRGRLRFGASEDFVLSALPDVLAAFVRRHPDVDMELTAGLSEDLYHVFDAGDLDIIFVKRRAGDGRGVSAWREPIAWFGQADYWLDPDAPLPLLVYPAPSVTRALAFEALDTARRPWRIAFTSGSLSALSAAARAGIGLMPHSVRLAPPGLAVAPTGPSLPRLPEVEFVIIRSGRGDAVAEALTGVILQWAAYGAGRTRL